MWAIYNKETESLIYLTDSKHYLIFESKVEAWSYLVNELDLEDKVNDYDVIQIRWVKA